MGNSLARVLVTGGLGFIGTNLVRELRSRGHDVWVADIKHSSDLKSIRTDVSVFRQVERVLEAYDFEYVYHASAEYGRWNGEEYYENLWDTNAVGTKNILRMQEKKRFKMIFFGSAEVYGDYQGVMNEDLMDKVEIKQLNDYAMSKWVNEIQILNSATIFGTETVRVRLFNVYGPGEHVTPYRGFVPNFIYSSMNDLPYTVYLRHKRTLEYVDDICRTFADVLERFKAGAAYNLGGDSQYEIKAVSDLILRQLGKNDSKVTYKESEPFTTKIKTPDTTKAKRDLGFELKVPLEEGIAKTIEWFRRLPE
jgi:dTDP-glucose 4,6-dehydratase